MGSRVGSGSSRRPAVTRYWRFATIPRRDSPSSVGNDRTIHGASFSIDDFLHDSLNSRCYVGDAGRLVQSNQLEEIRAPAKDELDDDLGHWADPQAPEELPDECAKHGVDRVAGGSAD